MENSVLAIFCVFISLFLIGSCTLFEEETFIEDGKNIRFIFDAGLNEEPRFGLPKDANGYYYMTLTKGG